MTPTETAETVATFANLIAMARIPPDSPRGVAYAASLARRSSDLSRACAAIFATADPATLRAAAAAGLAILTGGGIPECYAMTGEGVRYRAEAWAAYGAHRRALRRDRPGAASGTGSAA
jgi:hypothetical protein